MKKAVSVAQINDLYNRVDTLFDKMVETNTSICNAKWNNDLRNAHQENFEAIELCASVMEIINKMYLNENVKDDNEEINASKDEQEVLDKYGF